MWFAEDRRYRVHVIELDVSDPRHFGDVLETYKIFEFVVISEHI